MSLEQTATHTSPQQIDSATTNVQNALDALIIVLPGMASREDLFQNVNKLDSTLLQSAVVNLKYLLYWNSQEVSSLFEKNLLASLQKYNLNDVHAIVKYVDYSSIIRNVNHYNFSKISLPSLPLLRQMANHSIVDVLMYCSPKIKQQIDEIVIKECNALYDIACEAYQQVKKVIIVGHSLGSIVAYNIVKQNESDVVLHFVPHDVYLLGSPLGLFLSLQHEVLDGNKKLLRESNLYHIFHPLDAVAYRLDPFIKEEWINQDAIKLTTALVALHEKRPKKKSIVRKRLKSFFDFYLTKQNKKNKEIHPPQTNSIREECSQSGSSEDQMEAEAEAIKQVIEEEEEEEIDTSSGEVTPKEAEELLQHVDFQLPYMTSSWNIASFLTQMIKSFHVHLTYWNDKNVGEFIVSKSLLR